MVNQLDFFPTFLSLTDSRIAPGDFAELSGLDISSVLHGKRSQVLDVKGKERDHLFWHYPHGRDMKSAIRSGDFKLYKRYETNDYELYRLYQNGKRNDFEEVNDLVQKPEYASVVERLSGMLDEALVANNAELPYLNPNYKDKTAPSASLGDSSFKRSTRKAQLAIEASGPIAKEAYVIYCEAPSPSNKKKKRRTDDVPVTTESIPGMRLPATVSESGSSVSAIIPEGIAAFCFMLIDENGFMQYSEVVVAK